MTRLRVGSLFTGWGGLDMAVTTHFGAEIAWHSEINPQMCQLLEHRHPTIPNLGDITRVDWTQVPPVDIICGGSPCQDLSTAGARAGMTDGTRSNLWVQMREAVATLTPQFVVWENVHGALSAAADSSMEPEPGLLGNGSGEPVLRALGRVLGDLASLGYDCRWTCLRVADVGGCHNRMRVFLLGERQSSTHP